MSGHIYTIGHSTHPSEEFFQMLKDNKIDILVDVRSVPYSKYAPQFNQENIKENTDNMSITYAHEPEAFGARQLDKELYNSKGYLDFDKVRNRTVFKHKVAEYAEKMREGKNVAFMCSEKDPIDCHRAIMVGRGFALQDVPVEHIMSDGKVISQDDLDKRLLKLYFPGYDQASLFDEYSIENDNSLIKKAYELRNEKIGYKYADLEKSMNLEKERQKTLDEWQDVNEQGVLLSTDRRIASFRGKYGFLSNMYDCPVEFNGVTYQSSEVAFQAQKCLYDSDKVKFSSMDGVEAKKFGRKVAIRKDWEKVKKDIMRDIVSAKFAQHPDLAKRLIATGDKQLVEGNTWYDTYWGVFNGRGKNVLGKILMDVREELIMNKSVDVSDTIKTKDKPAKKPYTVHKDKDEFVISVTGHRPNRLFGYDWKNKGNVALSNRIESVLKETLAEAEKQGYKKFRVVTGMALGADQMFTANALRIASAPVYHGKLKVEAAVPCKDQEKQWPEASQKIYNVLLKQCDDVTMVSDKPYTPKAMQDRNEYMVDKANIVLSVYDGYSKGGTGNCIEYAKKVGVPVKDIGLPELFKEYPRFQSRKSLKPNSFSKSRPDEDNHL